MRPLAVVGVIAIAAGFLVAFDAGLAQAFDLSSIVVTLIGALAIVQGTRYVNTRRGRTRASVDLGEPERREPATVPGTALDDDIANAMARRYRGHNTRERIRGRVRSVAVRAVARGRNCSVDRAETLVERGEWTDDRIAAAFLSPSVRYPLRVRLRGGLFGRPTYRVGVSAAVHAIERVAHGAEGGTANGTEPLGADGGGTAATGRGRAD